MNLVKEASFRNSHGDWTELEIHQYAKLKVVLSNGRTLEIDLYEREPGTIECSTESQLVTLARGGCNVVGLHPMDGICQFKW